MAAKRRQERVLHGLLGELSPGGWVLYELQNEASRIAREAEEGARPVSVRVDNETLVLLDAFAVRFNLSRSSMLTKLIHGGLGEAFRRLPASEQQRMWDTVKMSLPYGEMTFAELFAAAKAAGEIDEIPQPMSSTPEQPTAVGSTDPGGQKSLPGIFGAQGPAKWIEAELEWEAARGRSASLDDGRVPVSVRLTVDAIALLDAFANRFGLSRSGMLMRLIRGGLAQAYRALPTGEQERMLVAVRIHVPDFGKSFAETIAEAKAKSGDAPTDDGTAEPKRRGRATKRDAKR